MTYVQPTNRKISVEEAAGKTVGEVMMRSPKSLPAEVNLGEVRRAFDRPAVRMVLLTDGQRFVGCVERDSLPADAPDATLARAYADTQPPTVRPDTPMTDAMELLNHRAQPRLIVLDHDGVTLLGLLCSKGDGTGFCVR